ncbi:hypothetical protein LguiB_013890 [Lonicera macranthoides]
MGLELFTQHFCKLSRLALDHFMQCHYGSRKAVLKSEGHPIKDLNDPRVQEIGKFAVNEHNKEAKTNLVYKSVIKGEVFLDISGTYYRLTILATNNDKYVADVIDRPLERLRKLVSFKKIFV